MVSGLGSLNGLGVQQVHGSQLILPHVLLLLLLLPQPWLQQPHLELQRRLRAQMQDLPPAAAALPAALAAAAAVLPAVAAGLAAAATVPVGLQDFARWWSGSLGAQHTSSAAPTRRLGAVHGSTARGQMEVDKNPAPIQSKQNWCRTKGAAMRHEETPCHSTRLAGVCHWRPWHPNTRALHKLPPDGLGTQHVGCISTIRCWPATMLDA